MTQKNKMTHEDFSSREEKQPGSDRNFGLVFTAVFGLIALVPLYRGYDIHWWALALAMAFLGVAIFAPLRLAPLNRIWFRFGLFLHKIVNPVILGVMYFVIFTPFALILRIMGKQPLVLRFDSKASTYWIARTPPGPAPESMTQQF